MRDQGTFHCKFESVSHHTNVERITASAVEKTARLPGLEPDVSGNSPDLDPVLVVWTTEQGLQFVPAAICRRSVAQSRG